MKKPIMTPEVEAEVLDAIAQFRNKDKWKAWGMDTLREQGAAILLEGPPGTGKTHIAKWMAGQVGKGFCQFSLADIGGGDPGQTERGVDTFFADCKAHKNRTIYMDEVDHLIMSRTGNVEASWQIGTTEAIMMNLSTYKGLVIASTNLTDMLDEAVFQRFLAIVHVARPDQRCRELIWKQKWPAKLPLQITDKQFKTLAEFDLNGRQIENSILNAVKRAIRKSIKPTMQLMIAAAENEEKKEATHGQHTKTKTD